MAHFTDLSPCNYFGPEFSETLLAVGWLASTEGFTTGATQLAVYEKLQALLKDPWQPFIFAGIHTCELCQFDGPSGTANLFLPIGSSIMVCPELISHYIAAHHYSPPQTFQQAVLNCPDTRSMEYKKLLLASGGRSLVRGSR